MIRVMSVLLAVILISLSPVIAQEMKKEEMKKDAAGVPTKSSESMGEMKVGSCSPECGFMVRSHDESEVVEMVKMHAKKQHNMDMSDKDAMARLKPAGHMEHKEVKKEMKKEERKEMK